ncbi:prolyl oligopeptidase family serine peptidase [Enterococcus sp. DIV1420a]|uniref:prolyl oligopeptidase family serine peptidase n=1 Tax=Enterococcus sp. DIV1420a TaxID=2774672 RepID=UPI003F2401D5
MDNNERPIYFDGQNLITIVIIDSTFQIKKNGYILYNGIIGKEFLNYEIGSENIYIYSIKDCIVRQRILNIQNEREIDHSFTCKNFKIENTDIFDFYRDAANNSVLICLEEAVVIRLVENDYTYEVVDSEKFVPKKGLEYSYVNLNTLVSIGKKTNEKNETNIVINGEETNFQEVYTYDGKVICIEKLNEMFRICFDFDEKKQKKYTGIYEESIQYKDDIFIRFTRNGKTNVIKINILKSTSYYILSDKMYRIELLNVINQELLYLKDYVLEGLSLCLTNSKSYINVKGTQLSKNKFKIESFIGEKFCMNALTNKGIDKSDVLLISFHGGPESYEQLDSSRYGYVYESLLNFEYKRIKIVTFNYPGSISFGELYRTKPYANWKNTLQDSFNELMEFLNVSSEMPVFLIGGSFGATASLMIKNEKYNIKKIAINPLMNLRTYVNSIPKSYREWFEERFAHRDYNDITFHNLIKENNYTEVLFVKGLNDEVIVNNWEYKDLKMSNHFIHVDNGKHNSNLYQRSNSIKSFIFDRIT